MLGLRPYAYRHSVSWDVLTAVGLSVVSFLTLVVAGDRSFPTVAVGLCAIGAWAVVVVRVVKGRTGKPPTEALNSQVDSETPSRKDRGAGTRR